MPYKPAMLMSSPANAPPFRGELVLCFGAGDNCAATVTHDNARIYRYGIPDGIRRWGAFCSYRNCEDAVAYSEKCPPKNIS